MTPANAHGQNDRPVDGDVRCCWSDAGTFQMFVDRNADAMFVFDPETNVFVDCNAAAVKLLEAPHKEHVLKMQPADLSPAAQPCGRPSAVVSAEVTAIVAARGSHRFEWLAYRADGSEIPLDVFATHVEAGGRALHIIIARDISDRKRAEEQVRRFHQTLERQIEERTAELRASEERLRKIVEHAPEAIVVFDGETGRFLVCNENAVQLYGYSREELLRFRPEDVSPLVQPDGRLSVDVAREKIREAVEGGTPVFEWVHKHSSGRLLTCEVRLLRLPADGRPLIRGSVTDMTERKRREQIQRATYNISQAVHEAEDLARLYARIHSIVGGLMPARNFYIALFDPAAATISFPYFVDESEAPPGVLPLGKGLTGYVLKTGKPLLVGAEMNARKRRVGDEVTFEGFPDLRYVESGTPAAIWLGVPLRVGGPPFGMMVVQDYHDETAYGEEEKQILTFVAAQTALAIERKRAEQALRESEEKFRALFEASGQGVILHDEEKFLEVNPATLRILGFDSADEIVGHHPVEFAAPVQPGGEPPDVLAKRYIGQCLTTGSARFDWICRNPKGEEIPLEVILTRVQWSGRQIIQAVISDISERKRTEETLRQRHHEVTTLLESLPGYAFFKDAQGRYVMANQNFARALGQTSQSILGKSDHELFPAELAEKYRADDARLLKTGEPLVIGEEQMIEAGRRLTVQTTKVPVKNDRGEVVGLIGLGFDITDRKNAEAELLKALAREKELGELKSSFVSMVSHEFRTPLGIIMSSAEILRDYLAQLDPEERERHLESIRKNTRRMANLMEEVLLLGKFDAGKMEFDPRWIDISGLCRRLIDEVLSAIDCHCPISIQCEGLPAHGNADERLLRHIFVNLLSNAVKYSDCGSPISFAVERDGPDAVFRVIDRGIGIPPADREWLFNAFHRGRNVGQRPGTGLGMVIVKRCVELHRGKIAVESTLGEGTTVIVRLPIFNS